MITDAQTDFVYFSAWLKKDFEPFYNELIGIFERHNVKHYILPDTKDKWCRDYMPIQISLNKFVEYCYDPDYLKTQKLMPYKSYPDIICKKLGLKTVKTDVILDGGNVIKADRGVILTDKIIKENRAKYNRDQLIGKLKELFEVEQIIIIPWDKKNEEYGHADGMIRFIRGNKVLINGYFREYEKAFQASLFGALDRAGFEYEELVYESDLNEEITWGYINFLQTKDLLLIPKFGLTEDQQAFDQISKHFPDYAARKKVEQIDASEIIKEGGALNCISWNIKQ